MRVKGLKLHDVVTALEEAGYYVDELYADADDDQVIDVYADEDSQRVLEMTFDSLELKCIAYCFVQTGFAGEYEHNITETLEALNA